MEEADQALMTGRGSLVPGLQMVRGLASLM
jgi:hypothetical protein